MPPKKKVFNGYAMFMSETKKKLANQGKHLPMSAMADYCKSDWEQMSQQMKDMYKVKAKEMKLSSKIEKMTSVGENVDEVLSQNKKNDLQFSTMYSYIEELVRLDRDFLSKQTFIFIHVNSYVCEKENFFFPCEISMAEYSLHKGLIRRFHQLVGFDKKRTNAPPAPTADINAHAKANHRITTFEKLPNNYTDVLLKIIGFIIDREVDESVLNDSTLDMPPIFTAHNRNEVSSLSITNLSLFQLYDSAVEYASRDDFDKLLKVYHLDKLFKELKNASFWYKNPNSNDQAIPSVAMASDYLNKDMSNTVNNVGCTFHERLEVPHVCSNYYICKWIYMFSTHCCSFFDIKMIAGCHYNFDLSKTEPPLEESMQNLNFNDDDYFSNYKLEKKHTRELTASNFPTLGGAPSTFPVEPIWTKPETKVNVPRVRPNESHSFPPLGNVPHSIPASSSQMPSSDWRKNACKGRGFFNSTK